MLKRIYQWINKQKYKGVELTPKGECFKRYCEKVYEDNSTDKIESYEEFIDYIRSQVADSFGIILDREDAVEFILEVYKEIL